MAKVLTTANIRLLLGKLGAESNVTITAVTNASPAVATLAAHGFSVGDVLVISGTTGLTALNGLRTVATAPSANTFTLNDFVAGTAINGNGTFGGTVLTSRVKVNLVPGDLDDLQAAMAGVSSARGPFSDTQRANESSLSTILGA